MVVLRVHNNTVPQFGEKTCNWQPRVSTLRCLLAKGMGHHNIKFVCLSSHGIFDYPKSLQLSLSVSDHDLPA